MLKLSSCSWSQTSSYPPLASGSRRNSPVAGLKATKLRPKPRSNTSPGGGTPLIAAGRRHSTKLCAKMAPAAAAAPTGRPITLGGGIESSRRSQDSRIDYCTEAMGNPRRGRCTTTTKLPLASPLKSSAS